jgi:hypothetical protein
LGKGAPILLIRILMARSFLVKDFSDCGNTPIRFSSSRGNGKGHYLPNVDSMLDQFTLDADAPAERDTIVHSNVASRALACKTTKDLTVRNQNSL